MTATDRSKDPAGRRPLPIGTVTFLRTDVEGSMALARTLGSGWDAVNDTHMGLLRAAVEGQDGVVVRTEGDALFAVFPEAGAAVRAAVEAQRAIGGHDWPATAPVRVRIGLHSGEAHLAGDDYGGFDVNRASRIAAAGHGGQIVVSETTRALTADGLPAGATLRDLGEHVLRDLPRPERLWQLDVAGLPSAFPPLRTLGAVSGNLPIRLSTFIGRDRELDDVVAQLGRARLVTLTGPGGIGKSSLAIEGARRVGVEYDDGAWFVPLDTLADPEGLGGAIARAIGLYDGPERAAADALRPYLAPRSMLLVLDNFEQLLDAAPTVSAILTASPGTRVVVTSRAPLRVTGEQEYPVPPLTASGPALFAERARAVHPDWQAGDDADAVDAICAVLDGLPLGIELAAARVAILPVTAIRDRLIAHLPLPGHGPRDVPARQRTLDAAVAWSHDLLTRDRQVTLECLAVFEGGFGAEQAAAVARPGATTDGMLDDLVELAEQSLIARDASSGPEVRFRMLQTIVTFGLARLAASGLEHEVRRRHAVAYLELAERAMTHMSTVTQGRWLARLRPDSANLREAVRWAIDAGETELALRLVGTLWRFWHSEGTLVQGRELTEHALAMPGADAPTPARMWATAAAGSIAYWQSDPAEAGVWYREQMAIATALSDTAAIADAQFNLGHVAFIELEDPVVQMAHLRDGIERFRAIGDERGVARIEWATANLMLRSGDVPGATAVFERSLGTFETLGDAQYHAMTCGSLGWARFVAGDLAAACRWSVQAIRESHAMGDLGTTTISLHVGVLMAVLLGHPEDGARLTGAFETLCERHGVRPPIALRRFLQHMDPFAMARNALPEDEWKARFAEGSRMTLDEAVALIVELGAEVDEARFPVAGPPPAQ